jgi:pantoate--beta-alanine ligase
MASITRKLRRENRTVGFVPTMGALHGGHFALIKEARQMSDIVIVSIFVNPAQFDDKGDLERYPRDLTADAALISEYEVDYIFAPDLNEMYPKGFSTYVYVDELSESLEGASRPGHFRGVSTVVAILFNTIRPDLAFFGQKDAQQLAIIRKLAGDLGYETEIIAVGTVREPSGLAMSSRNLLLSSDERERAAIVFRSLCDAKNAFDGGERNASRLTQIVLETIEPEPLAAVDYIAVADPDTLQPIDTIGDKSALLAVAVKFGGIRLIDNIILGTMQ